MIEKTYLTLDEFFDIIKTMPSTDYIVKLRYRYDYEKEWTVTNEILEYYADSKSENYIWLNDWFEGQQWVEIMGFIPVEDVEVVRSKHTLVEQVPFNGVVCTLTLNNVQGIESNKFKNIFEEAITWLHKFCWKVRG